MSEKPVTQGLDYYVSVAKNLSNYESAVELINKVVESPLIYSFSEIIETPFISSVFKIHISLFMRVNLNKN